MNRGISNQIVAGLLYLAIASPALADEVVRVEQGDPVADSAFEARHQQAVELARADQTKKGLAMLEALLLEQPDSYPVRRDYVIILSWDGDCDAALEQYEIVRHRPVLDAYLYPPVSECMAALRDHDRALATLDEGMKAYPEDEDIKNTLKNLQDTIKHEARPDYSISIGTTESAGSSVSGAGNREWFMSARYSEELTTKARWYLRYYASQADDSDGIPAGELSRLRLGVRYWFNPKWLLDQSISREMKVELDGEKRNGAQTGLTYFVNSRAQVTAEYANNAEDVPLRAKAQGTTVNRTVLSVDYHTPGYVWEFSESAARYKFSDTNERKSFYLSAGYGYSMEHDIEHRLIGEFSTSKNTLPGAVYFNPSKDTGVTLVHRTAFVFDSAYDRHVDHLSVFAGKYDQDGYDAESVYGVGYRQEYDFSDAVTLGLSLEYASRVYDGERESQTSISMTLSGRLP